MRKLAAVATAVLIMMGSLETADAQSWRGRGWGYHGGYYRHGGGAVAAGLIGGAILGGLITAAATAPAYGYGYGYGYPAYGYGAYAHGRDIIIRAPPITIHGLSTTVRPTITRAGPITARESIRRGSITGLVIMARIGASMALATTDPGWPTGGTIEAVSRAEA